MINNLESGMRTSQVLDNIRTIKNDAMSIKEKCTSIRSFLDEGMYKIEAVQNIVNNMKTQESKISESGQDQAVIQQLTEEQIDSFLEMLKTPTFQNLIKQLLSKWASSTKTHEA